MPSKEVPNLDPAGALDGTELLHIVQGINSRKETLAAIAAWILATVPPGGISQAFADGRYLRIANNLSDIASAATARGNLGLGSAALLASNAVLQVANNLADLASAAAARGNLSVYSTAQVDALIAGITSGTQYEEAPIKPAIASFTLQNGGTVNFANTKRGIVMNQTVATGAGIQQIRFAKDPAYVAHSNFTMTARMQALSPQQSGVFQPSQLIMRNATSGRLMSFGDRTAANAFGMDIWSGYTSGNAGSNSWNVAPQSWPWRRVTFDGTTFSFQTSPDGDQWCEATSYLLSAYLNVCDEIGWGIVEGNQSQKNGSLLTHWKLN